MSDPLLAGPDWLRVPLPGGGTADFHHRWLRHACDCDRHPATRERTLCSSELPDELRPVRARVEGDRLLVTWSPDDHESAYPLTWLEAHAYARDRAAAPPPPSDVARIELEARAVDEGTVREALARVALEGAALVRYAAGAPEDETEVIVSAFERAGLRVVPTHFGRIEDLRTDNTTNQNTDQLGYTDAAIGLHTDQPFLDEPPRYQLLQSVRAAESGGENAIADALAAARYLADHEPDVLALLTETPVTFHRRQQRFERVVVAPILRLDPFQVRASYFTLAPHALPFERMTAFYRAHDRFFRLLRDPRHHYRFALRPGDFLLYDNHRVLHARTAFRGARWVRGIYFERAGGVPGTARDPAT